MGNPAKVVRIHASDRTAAENQPAAIRREVAPVAPVPVENDTATRARGKERERGGMLATGPYLPITGALPLRFSSARRWPAPLPKEGPPAADALPLVAAVSTPTARPIDPGVQTTVTTVAAEPAQMPAAKSTPVASVPNASAPVPTMLTADMVLSYLDDLPPAEARVSLRFEPALPQEATRSAGLSALTP